MYEKIRIKKNDQRRNWKKSFYRLPGHVIGNEFYTVMKKLTSIYYKIGDLDEKIRIKKNN